MTEDRINLLVRRVACHFTNLPAQEAAVVLLTVKIMLTARYTLGVINKS